LFIGECCVYVSTRRWWLLWFIAAFLLVIMGVWWCRVLRRGWLLHFVLENVVVVMVVSDGCDYLSGRHSVATSVRYWFGSLYQ
jgi:hypothetical protein